MTTPNIMAYFPAGTVSGAVSGGTFVPDWANVMGYTASLGASGGTDGLHQFDLYPNAVETLGKTINTMGITGVGSPLALTYGDVLAFPQGASNSVQIWFVQASTLTALGSFGTVSSSLAPSTVSRILCPYTMAPLRRGGTDYVVTTSLGTTNEVNCLNVNSNMNTNLGTTTEAVAACGRGATDQVFVLGKGNYSSGHNTTPLGLYVVDGVELRKIGTVSPAQVDATWTHFVSAGGIAYDQTDGNPIILVATDDAVTNKCYFVKLNQATAAVMWTCAVGAFNATADVDFGRYNITQQTLYYLDPASPGTTLWTINTATGVGTSQSIATLTCGSQISEDVGQSLICYGSFTNGGANPNYLGHYMGTLGNHSVNSIWIRFFPGVVGVIPTPPAVLAQTRNRAWSFVIDGHTFYALDLGSEGTWLYDTNTGEWCNWVTSGFVQWDVANGCMWGQRVVGGDISSTQVWEARNSQLSDNGTDIAHVVSGELTTRSRVFRSCAAVRIAGSIGVLDDSGGVNINLTFSDDDGHTFQGPFTVALTESNYSGEIAWRSLGSFAAPGRVFVVADTGGLVNIDGCDAFIDDFDEDQPTLNDGEKGEQ